MPLTLNPLPTIASDLTSTYQFTAFIAEVQEPSATPPPSTVPTTFPSSVLPPYLPCTEATPMPAQVPVFFFPSPVRHSLSKSLTDPTTVRPLPLYRMPLSFLDLATQPPKEAPAPPSTRPPSPAPPSLRMPCNDPTPRRMLKGLQSIFSGPCLPRFLYTCRSGTAFGA